MNAIELLKQFEGCSLTAYQDIAGNWTIGYGSLLIPDGTAVKRGDTITAEAADMLLSSRASMFMAGVYKMVRVPLTENQACSLTSFAYNEGLHALATSTLLRDLNSGDYASAAKQFAGWVYAGGRVVKGLVNRRKIEAENFLA